MHLYVAVASLWHSSSLTIVTTPLDGAGRTRHGVGEVGSSVCSGVGVGSVMKKSGNVTKENISLSEIYVRGRGQGKRREDEVIERMMHVCRHPLDS